MGGIQHRAGLRDVKTIHSVGMRSIPKVQRSNYLELYMLGTEKDRLEKEMFALEKRRNSAQKQLDSLNTRIEKLRKEVHVEQKRKTYRNIPTKPLRTMPIRY